MSVYLCVHISQGYFLTRFFNESFSKPGAAVVPTFTDARVALVGYACRRAITRAKERFFAEKVEGRQLEKTLNAVLGCMIKNLANAFMPLSGA